MKDILLEAWMPSASHSDRERGRAESNAADAVDGNGSCIEPKKYKTEQC